MKYQQLKSGEKYKKGDVYISDKFFILAMKDARCIVEENKIFIFVKKKHSHYSSYTEGDTVLGHKRSFRKVDK